MPFVKSEAGLTSVELANALKVYSIATPVDNSLTANSRTILVFV